MNVLTPLPSWKWSRETAAHLLNRAAFGGTPSEIEAAHQKGLSATVQELIDFKTDAAAPSPPAWARPRDIRDMRMGARRADNPELRKEQMREIRKMEEQNILDLRRWWLDAMMHGRAPLLEKMTLFWHGHFATSVQKVKDGYWMWHQNDSLRRKALGNFAALTKEISRDPAMMIYLDLQQSRKEHPNENWARELMELFTVGIGNYSENDIRESARAFTGYRIDMTTQQFRFARFQQDAGPKTFMGRGGPLRGDDIIDILVQQPACARFLGRKIWRFFVEDDPAAPIVETIASRMRAHNYEIRPLLREIFSSAEFYSPGVMRNQIKSPIQFLIQTSKLLETELPAPMISQNALRQMGQIPFAPPNVKGWDGGKAWISTSTLLFRYNFANYLLNGDAMIGSNVPREKKGDLGFRGRTAVNQAVQRAPVDLSKIVPDELRQKPEELVDLLSQRLFQQAAPDAERKAFVQYLDARKPDTSDQTMRGLLHLMMSTALFQVT